MSKQIQGHLYALFTVLIWGTCFISTKVLLRSSSPIEIMFVRFVIAYIALFIISPRLIPYRNIKEELLFVAAGACGVTLYYFFSNYALTYTLSMNVGILNSVAPFFTAILSYLILKDEELHRNFFIGFFLAIIGIILIGFNGSYILRLNPKGDLLAILAPIAWAFYTIIMKKLGTEQYTIIQSTRKTFFYGVILSVPMLILFRIRLDWALFNSWTNILNLLFLSIGSSAIGYISWNFAVSVIGTIKTSIYAYIIPIVSVISSTIILHEELTLVAVIGVILILFGLLVSTMKMRPMIWIKGKYQTLKSRSAD